ncbi:hypothetical protein G6F50_017167 [Rhizopus delemar]|uniref:Uncharacterized protein n=1 Tax=Rhizopus delemar TaxID=936053 RepID=A0A9P6XQS5_9FUNG|nr:hypothetical protein G6F50_017167 [Rhizopus delemar]
MRMMPAQKADAPRDARLTGCGRHMRAERKQEQRVVGPGRQYAAYMRDARSALQLAGFFQRDDFFYVGLGPEQRQRRLLLRHQQRDGSPRVVGQGTHENHIEDAIANSPGNVPV